MNGYELIRSARKTLCLQIYPGDPPRVVVRAPRRLPMREIEAFVQSKQPWLTRQLTQLSQRASTPAPNAVPLFGQLLPLNPEGPLSGQPLSPDGMTLPGEIFIKGHGALQAGPQGVRLPEGMPQSAGIAALYQVYARQVLPPLVARCARRMDIAAPRMTVTGAKTRWGSCSSLGVVHFSFRLMAAPPGAIEYVVIHELCHLAHPHHQASFWQAVAAHCPDLRAQRAVLKEAQARLAEVGL